MRIKTIAADYERTFNLGDYNSAKIKASVWADLDVEKTLDENGQVIEKQAEDVREVYAAIFAEAKEQVRLQSLPVLRPQMKAILEQLNAVKLDQDGLRGILTSLIANGSVTIKIGLPTEDTGNGQQQQLPAEPPRQPPAPTQAKTSTKAKVQTRPAESTQPPMTAAQAQEKYKNQQGPATLSSKATEGGQTKK